jgi:Tol biopolymer transport system component
MSGLDDRLRRDLHRLGRSDMAGDPMERVASKRRRYRVWRRVQAASLSVGVFVIAGAGVFGLVRAFSSGTGTPHAQAPASAAGTIAFARSTPQTSSPGGGGGPYVARSEIYLMNPDGTGVHQLTETKTAGSVATAPSWSPDGTRIAFVVGDPRHLPAYAGDGDIAVMNADGTGLVRLTESQRDAGPAWSPDGTKIAFVRDQGSALFVMNSDGTAAKQIYSPSSCAVQSPTWSPDGAEILFREGCDVGRLFSVHPDGTGATALTPTGFDAYTPAYSPDGKRVVFGHGSDLWSMNNDGSGRTPITNCVLPQCVYDIAPTWSPDGSRIAFVRDVNGGNDFQVWEMNADGTDVHALTTGPDWNQAPAWNPIPPSPSPSPPTQVPSVPSDAVIAKEIGPACDTSKVTGDFDGDGSPDVAVVFFRQPPSGSCDVPADQRQYQLGVWWADGTSGIWPLPDCGTIQSDGSVNPTGTCRAFAAPDLNGDGTDELAIETDRGASVSQLQFYPLPPSERPKEPITLSGQVFVLAWGAAATHDDSIECLSASQPNVRPRFGIGAFHSELDQQTNQWHVTQTNYAYDGFSTVTGTASETSVWTHPAPAGSDVCGAPIQGQPLEGSISR